MKKIFTLAIGLLPFVFMTAAQRIVWTGNEPISWNTEVYAGSQFETPEGIFAGLNSGDTILATVLAAIDEPQYVLTYKAGDSWEWTDLVTSVSDGVMTYVVDSDAVATYITERGLIFRGQGYDLLSIIVATPDTTPVIPDTIPVIPGEREEEILFEGNQVLSASGEDNLGIEASLFANMVVGDSITVDIIDLTDSYCQLNIAANNPWTVIPGTNWTALAAAGHYAYVVEDQSLVQAIQASGITIQGKNCTITRVTLSPYVEDTVPPVDPDAEIDYTGLYETVVYQPESAVAISWDNEAWPGIKLDTRNIDETMFAGLQENDIIRVTVVDAEEDAEYSMQYKAGDEWAWTDLHINLATEGYMAYRVADDSMAMLIADRGLVIQGIRYKVSCISVFSNDIPEGLEKTAATQNSETESRKIFLNGQLLILSNGILYTVQGQMTR